MVITLEILSWIVAIVAMPAITTAGDGSDFPE
jgi:hypothetical protein